jgi:hypothetical protein
MEAQKTSNQSNPERKEQSWRRQSAWFQGILPNHSSQESMVLAEKQSHRLMEQNTYPRNKPTHP